MSQSLGVYFSPHHNLEYIAMTTPKYSAIQSPPGYSSLSERSMTSLAYLSSRQSVDRPSSVAASLYSGSSSSTGQRYDTSKEYASQNQTHAEYHFLPDQFIRPGKEGVFIGDAEEIRPFIEETFQLMFACPFPKHINLSILREEEFRKIAPHPNAIGLSFNRTKYGGISDIFVLRDSLARVMLTLGHELGHVLTETLSDPHDEEAKAYAFSLAWMKTIKEHNIAHLGGAIILENPALNGLHNVSFSFVQKMLGEGKEVWDLYLGLIRQEEHVSAQSILAAV